MNAHNNRPDAHRPDKTRPQPSGLDDLQLYGLVSRPHRADHDHRHDEPLRPSRFFTPDPDHETADIA